MVHYFEGQHTSFSDSVSGNKKLPTPSSPLHFIPQTIFHTKHGKVCAVSSMPIQIIPTNFGTYTIFVLWQ
jgi:hypothetical protein